MPALGNEPPSRFAHGDSRAVERLQSPEGFNPQPQERVGALHSVFSGHQREAQAVSTDISARVLRSTGAGRVSATSHSFLDFQVRYHGIIVPQAVRPAPVVYQVFPTIQFYHSASGCLGFPLSLALRQDFSKLTASADMLTLNPNGLRVALTIQVRFQVV